VLIHEGHTYRRINVACVKYHIKHLTAIQGDVHGGPLIDGGSNGRLYGADVRVPTTTSRHVRFLDTDSCVTFHVNDPPSLLSPRPPAMPPTMIPAPTALLPTADTSDARVKYHVANSTAAQGDGPGGSLIDGGANGGLCGADVRVLAMTATLCDVTGVGDSAIENLPIVQAAGLLQTQNGPVIGIFHQYANFGQGNLIHSSGQLRSFGNIVDDCSRRNGGTQRLLTPDGYVIPFSIREGLTFMDMRPPPDDEMELYPHVMLMTRGNVLLCICTLLLIVRGVVSSDMSIDVPTILDVIWLMQSTTPAFDSGVRHILR